MDEFAQLNWKFLVTLQLNSEVRIQVFIDFSAGLGRDSEIDWQIENLSIQKLRVWNTILEILSCLKVIIVAILSSLFMTQHENSGLGGFIVEVSRSDRQTDTHTHAEEFLWTSNQLVSEASTYKTHNKHKTQTPMTSQDSKPHSQQSRGYRPTL
jgi:hypothetical protein